MQLVSLRTHFLNHYKKANETRLELMIPFQLDVTHAQQNRITNIEIYSMMPAIVPLRLMLLYMPEGYLRLLCLLNYIAHILLSTFVWMHTPQHVQYSLNILSKKQLK